MESVNEINSLAAAGFQLNAIIGRVANERHPPLPPRSNDAYFVCIDREPIDNNTNGDRIPDGETLPCIPIVLDFTDEEYLSRFDAGVFKSIIFDWSVIDKMGSYEIRVLLKMWYRLLAWGGKLWLRGLHRGGGVNVARILTDLSRRRVWGYEASLLLHKEQYKSFGDILLREGTEVGFTTFAKGQISDGGYPIKHIEDRHGEQAYFVLIKE